MQSKEEVLSDQQQSLGDIISSLLRDLSLSAPQSDCALPLSDSDKDVGQWIHQRLMAPTSTILSVGESESRSLVVALAMMRNSFQCIYGTSLWQDKPPASLGQVLLDLEKRLEGLGTRGKPKYVFM